MITRYGVWLDSIPLDAIDPTIIITDIQESQPNMAMQTIPHAMGDGLRVTKRTRQSLSVVVRFVIREYDVTRRKAILQKIIGWAKAGKYLEINDRPEQRLRVEVDTMPTVQSALRWTQELSITFTAYGSPYWEEAMPDTFTTSGTVQQLVNGDADKAFPDVSVSPSASMVTVTVGDSHITLENVSGTVLIAHDNGVLSITEDGASILGKRTTDSSDDLVCIPGEVNTFSVAGGSALFTVRGRWT